MSSIPSQTQIVQFPDRDLFRREPGRDDFDAAWGQLLTSMYHIVFALSPGVFVQRYFEIPEGIEHPQQRQQQRDFWRRYAAAHWQEVLAVAPDAEHDDFAMLHAIGELLVQNPDHQRFRRILSVWLGRSLRWRLDLRETGRSWRKYVASQRELMDNAITQMQWIRTRLPHDFSADQFEDIRRFYHRFGETLDDMTADNRPDTARALMTIARPVATAFNGAWWYVFSGMDSPPPEPLSQSQGTEATTQEPERSRKQTRSSGSVWKQAKAKLEKLHQAGTLAETVRGAAKQLEAEGFKFSSVRTAAKRSRVLASRFNVQPDEAYLNKRGTRKASKDDDRLDAYLSQSKFASEKESAIDHLATLPAEDVDEILSTIATNPDTGRTGEFQLIEDWDQPADDHTASGMED